MEILCKLLLVRGRRCLVHSRMFSSISDLCSLDANIILPLNLVVVITRDFFKHCQMSSRETKPSWLGTSYFYTPIVMMASYEQPRGEMQTCKAYCKKGRFWNVCFLSTGERTHAFTLMRQRKVNKPTVSMAWVFCEGIAADSSGFYNRLFKQCQEPQVSPFREKMGYLNSLTLQKHKLSGEIDVSWRDL